jgi:hypothetical protein
MVKVMTFVNDISVDKKMLSEVMGKWSYALARMRARK